MGGVVRRALVVGFGGEAIDQAACGAERAPSLRPQPRRLSCQAAPGAPVNTVGAISANAEYNFGVRACEPRIKSGLAALIAVRSGLLRVPTPGSLCTAVPRYDGWSDEPSGSAAADHAGLQAERAQRVELVTGEHHDALRIGGHLDGVRLHPAALWACRVAGPASAGAASGAHDSSGLRWLPSTPAPAI